MGTPELLMDNSQWCLYAAAQRLVPGAGMADAATLPTRTTKGLRKNRLRGLLGKDEMTEITFLPLEEGVVSKWKKYVG